MDLERLFYTGRTYATITTWTLLDWIPILSSCFIGGDKGREVGRRIIRHWSAQLLKAGGVTWDVEGLENIDKNQNYVIISSHRSHLDGPLLNVVTPFTFSFVIKDSLGKIPLWGWAVRSVGYVPIVRHDKEKAKNKIQGALELLKKGESVLVFPEGSRSPTDEFLPFKKGGIVLAIQAQVPILPVAVSGTGYILPKGALTIKPGHALVRFGRPIPTKGLTYEHRNKLLKEVEEAVRSLYVPGPISPK